MAFSSPFLFVRQNSLWCLCQWKSHQILFGNLFFHFLLCYCLCFLTLKLISIGSLIILAIFFLSNFHVPPPRFSVLALPFLILLHVIFNFSYLKHSYECHLFIWSAWDSCNTVDFVASTSAKKSFPWFVHPHGHTSLPV